MNKFKMDKKHLRRPIAFQFMITIMIISCLLDANALTSSDIHISSDTISQGDMSLLMINVKKGEIPRVTWMNRSILLIPTHDKTCWQGFLVADLSEKPGNYKAHIKISQSSHEEVLGIKVVDKDYGVRRLKLPEKMVNLDEKSLKRVNNESAKLRKIWKAPASDPLWSGPFLKPIDGEVIGPFGRRSIINEQPRSPHTGVDLRGNRGTPVKASNNGKVVLTADHFFTGKTVILDHGGEILSMYFHLDKIVVQKDDIVRKGDIIGHVGSTGRATGPHLHWGIRINGARINPMRLITISRELEE
jgi:murein DD-endopeptidase MepM/ murein hydrolase activator NlpD